MPIRPENRDRYPKDWKAISARIRFERAAGRCECEGECGIEHEGRCDAWHDARHPVTDSIVVLTTAHLDHEPENCADENLRAMCQRCHNRYDLPKRRAGIVARARAGAAIAELPFASCDTRRMAETGNTDSVRSTGGAVPSEAQADAQTAPKEYP